MVRDTSAPPAHIKKHLRLFKKSKLFKQPFLGIGDIMTMQEIRDKYFKNEKILWQGSPENVPTFNKWDIFLIPFTLFLGIPMIFYTILGIYAVFTAQGATFALIGITAFIIGFYILFLRFWYRKKRLKKLLYFVTDVRVFCFDTMRNDVVFDIPLYETELGLGYKCLLLAQPYAIGDFIYNIGLDIFLRKFTKETPAFKYIDNIEEVSKIIMTNSKEKEVDDDSLFI